MTKRTRFIALSVISLAVLVPLAVASAQTTRTTKAPEAGPSGSTVSPDTGAPGKTADATSKAATSGPDQPAPNASPFGGNGMMIWGLFALIIVMFWWSSRSKKKQEQKHRDMLSALKKGDKITTIGGIIGTVIEVRDDEVVVKVDETNNVRMRFIRGSIRDVGQGDKTNTQDQKK
jgi:preprotein translocase subunit YajC